MPGVGPFAQVVPAPLRCSDGTKTFHLPAASTYRYGRSLETGLVSRVVYGGVGKLCGGAPTVPAKTWFQTPFDQPLRLELRTMNCCWLPLMVLPETAESEMNPPEANCGPAEQKSISDRPPLICTRRIGAACETAQNSLPVWQPVWPITLIVRFDIERQKFTSAVQSVGAPGGVGKHWLQHVDRAVDLHVGRVAAESGDLGVVADAEAQRLRRRPVRARLEQQREPAGAELVGDLPGGDRVDRGLDLRLRHARVEDQHVGPEVRVAGRGGGSGRGGAGACAAGAAAAWPVNAPAVRKEATTAAASPVPSRRRAAERCMRTCLVTTGAGRGDVPPHAPASPPRHRSGGRVPFDPTGFISTREAQS